MAFITVQQLLATLGIDLASVSVSPSGRYVLIQRDPQPSEEGIDINTDVEMTLIDLDGNPADPTLIPPDFTVTIEGVLALTYAGGFPLWSGPWTGAVTTHTAVSPYAFWRVDAQQTAPVFSSEQVVDVDVAISAPVVASFAYDFTIEDLTPPTMVSAEGIDPFTIRVTFDDDMAITGSGSILDLANWTDAIIRWNVDPVPGVNLEVTAVTEADAPVFTIPIEWTYADAAARLAATGFTSEEIGQIAFQQSDSTYWQLVDIAAVFGGYGYLPYGHFIYGHTPTTLAPAWREVTPVSQWDLTVNWEQTPGCRYQITAGPAMEDESGNIIDPTYDTADFDGFIPDPVEGRVFSHWRNMVPLKNRIEDATRDLERFSNCVEEVLGWLLYYTDRFIDQWDPDRATDEQIEAMLYDMGNPFSAWVDLELTAIQKRKLLRILIEIYKAKGTAWGIEQTVFFLLGEVVWCREYMAGGWVLGVDALGSGAIAEVMSYGWDTFDFTLVAAPWELEVKVDGGGTQVVTFVAGDFVNPAAATAAEVAAVITAQATGAGSYAAFPGQAAEVLGTNAEPFVVSPGDSLDVFIDGDPVAHAVAFTAADIAVPGAATAAELAARLTEDLEGFAASRDEAGEVAINTITRGALASIQIGAGVVQVALGLPLALEVGTDHGQVAVHSNKAGVEAAIQVTGGSANDALNFDTTEIGSTGGAVLAPDDSYTLYSFDIETENVLTSTQESIVRRVAEYMKPAHTHLINIRQALPLPWPDGWMLGVDELDETTELAE